MAALLRPAVLAVVSLLAAGCGGESTPTSDPPTPTQTPSSVPPTGNLPMTITRTGGIAGFSDRIVVGADGIATVSRRTGPADRCKVDATVLQAINSAVIDWASMGSKPPTARYPDDLVIAVAAHGGVTRLDDPAVEALVDPVGKLLAADESHCRPV